MLRSYIKRQDRARDCAIKARGALTFDRLDKSVQYTSDGVKSADWRPCGALKSLDGRGDDLHMSACVCFLSQVQPHIRVDTQRRRVSAAQHAAKGRDRYARVAHPKRRNDRVHRLLALGSGGNVGVAGAALLQTSPHL